jgi:hypothetical protein
VRQVWTGSSAARTETEQYQVVADLASVLHRNGLYAMFLFLANEYGEKKKPKQGQAHGDQKSAHTPVQVDEMSKHFVSLLSETNALPRAIDVTNVDKFFATLSQAYVDQLQPLVFAREVLARSLDYAHLHAKLNS